MKKIKKPFYKKKFFWLFLFSLFVFLSFFYFLFFSDFFLIKKINFLGFKKPEIEKLIFQKAKENFLKKENIFLINSKKIEKLILENFPDLKSVKILKKFPNEILLKIEKRKGVLIFCSQICYLIDEEGVLFKEAKNENLFKVEKENEKIFFGKKILSKEKIEKILKIKKELESLKIFPQKALLFEERAEFLINGFKIFFDLDGNVDFQLKKLKVSFEKIEKKENLEYLDLRFGNFVFPKYKFSQ